jgi:hypothetical protein
MGWDGAGRVRRSSHQTPKATIETITNHMKRLSIITLAMLALIGFMAPTVRAQNPHFQSCSSTGPDNSGNLQSCFKIAGLGQTPTLITASAPASAVYSCQNNGGNCPNAANKTTSTGVSSAQGTFTPTKNGSASGCLTLTPPPPPSNFSCPGNQTPVLVSVSYGTVTLSAPNGATCTTGGGSANFFPNCP